MGDDDECMPGFHFKENVHSRSSLTLKFKRANSAYPSKSEKSFWRERKGQFCSVAKCKKTQATESQHKEKFLKRPLICLKGNRWKELEGKCGQRYRKKEKRSLFLKLHEKEKHGCKQSVCAPSSSVLQLWLQVHSTARKKSNWKIGPGSLDRSHFVLFLAVSAPYNFGFGDFPPSTQLDIWGPHGQASRNAYRSSQARAGLFSLNIHLAGWLVAWGREYVRVNWLGQLNF